jgi:hypothetical protein
VRQHVPLPRGSVSVDSVTWRRQRRWEGAIALIRQTRAGVERRTSREFREHLGLA